MITNYSQAIEVLLQRGTITVAEFEALPRYVPSSLEVAGDRPIPIRSPCFSIIQDAAVLASTLDDRIFDWVDAGNVLQLSVWESEESGEPLSKDVTLGLRGMAMQADFAAGLMKVGGLT